MNKRTVLRALAFAVALVLCLSAAALADMAKGSRGENVAAVQRRLIELGFLDDVADGIFGRNTENAVIAFQRAMSMPATGIVDSDTERLLTGAGASGSGAGTKPVPAAPAETPTAPEVPGNGDVFAGLKAMEGCGWIGDEESAAYGLGRNASGQAVVYGISLVNSGAPARMALESVSWAVEIDTGSTDMMACWNDAKAGITSAKLDWHTEISSDGNVYSVAGVDVFLPDDPSIAGEQTVTVSLEGHTASVRLKLTYDGGYADGNGWKVEVLGLTADGETR